jgi:branched-chain amino acid transport system ATP-binding protein
MSAILAGESVSKHFGDLKAVDQVDFELHQGEILGLIGPNGAGKTTTLRAISGILPLSRGEIRFEGRSLAKVPAHQRPGLGIGLVPEGRELWPQLTVLENLELGAFPATARAQRRPLSTGSSSCSPACASAPGSSPAACPAASSRWWRSAAR